MEARMSLSLDNLELGNLNQKLTTMRDKLRSDIEQDMQFMHMKIKRAQDLSESDSSLSSATPHDHHPQSQQEQPAHPNDNRAPEDPHHRPQHFLDFEIAEPPIDLQEIRRLAAKQIHASQWEEYIKCTLSSEVVERLRELFEEMQDEGYRVSTREFAHRIARLGVKFSEPTAVEIPIINRRISLRKVLFELCFKARLTPERVTWEKFKETVQDYRFPPDPPIDAYMAVEEARGRDSFTLSAGKNRFNLSAEIVGELKLIYSKCEKEMFLSYCPLSSLLARMERSRVIQGALGCLVRPKGNYEVETTLKSTIQYITFHAPEFVDRDEFLLFFTVKGFTYYPIQQRGTLRNASQLSSDSSDVARRLKKARSDRPAPHLPKKKRPHFDEYLLSANNPNSIRNRKLKEMISEEGERQARESKSFKAKPMPKSISREKYQEFTNGMQLKLEQGRRTLEELRSHSQRELQRLKSETKLFCSPKKQEIEQHYYQITARPLPESAKSPRLNQIQQEKAARRQKILSQTQLKYQHSWQELPFVATAELPPNHHKHEQKPPKPHKIKVRDIPDYHTQQLRIQEELLERKQAFHPTQPSPFHFHTEARHENTHTHFAGESFEPIAAYDYKEIIYSEEPEIYYTQKFTEMVEANRKRAEQKERKASQQEEEAAERQKRHANFAKFMKASLRKLPDTAKICENEARMKIERHKKYWKNLDRQHEQNLNELYAKILKRPFLYELQGKPAQPKDKKRRARQRSLQ